MYFSLQDGFNDCFYIPVSEEETFKSLWGPVFSFYKQRNALYANENNLTHKDR
jgi:hypothetical protein